MRARLLALVVTVGCGADPAVTTDEPLPGWASVEDGALVARCGAVEVHARAYEGAALLSYRAAGARPMRSWAVVGELLPESAAVAGHDGTAVLRATALTIAIDEGCRVTATLADGTVIARDAETFAVGATARLERERLADRVYGLGERTGGLDKRGRAWTFWNTDAYDPAHGGWKPGQDPLYQSIPLEVRVRPDAAYGVFTDEPRRMVIDLSGARDTYAAERARTLDQWLFAGPRMADVLERYTRLTGRPAVPPRWALGFHQSRWGYGSGAELEAIAARFSAEALPLDALWLDIQHMRGFRSFTVDDVAFPPASLDRIRATGTRLVAIEDPGIKVDPGWDVYDSGVAGGHFLGATGVAWPGPAAFPDVSRAATRAWWGSLVLSAYDRGITGIWLDVNEPTTFPEGGGGNTLPDELPVDGDGAPTTMAVLHNAYALFQARATYEALATREARPFVLSRAGYAGIQRYAAVWTGDTPSTWEGLAQTLPMLLGLGISGVPIVGSDIGGYSGNASPELYARWLALGTISPFARAHVTSGVPGQEPWMFGTEVLEAARDRLAERADLAPYLAALAEEAGRTGAPILRPLAWELPGEDAEDEAMLGPFVLAAPVVERGATSRRVRIPAGRWFELRSDAVVDGPATIEVDAPLAALPLYARAGAIVPREGGVLDVWPGDAPTSFVLEGGHRVTMTPSATDVTIALDGAMDGGVRELRIHRVDGAVTSVDGGASWQRDDNARVLIVRTPGARVRVAYDRAIGEPAPPVAITFEVRAPANTAGQIHVATSANGWQHVALAWVAPGVARGTLVVPRAAWLSYKYSRGGWDTVEKAGDCTERPNRARLGAAGSRVDTIATWRDHCGS